jgi:hypothetical protein
MGAIFAKTTKGHDEIGSKAGGLTPRQRRVLIMVDGKRSVDELREILRADDLQHTLGLLEEAAFIEIVIAGTKDAVPATQALPPVTAFSALPEVNDPVRLQQARNFMLNTLKVFVGALGTSSLQDRIENTGSHNELRAIYDEWYHTIVMSREGRREAESLRTQLLQII